MAFEIIFIAVLVFVGTMAIAGLSAAPWVPTRRGELAILAKELTIKPGDRVYDLGCGDGSVLFFLAAMHPDARFIGIDLSLLPYLIARVRKLLGGKKFANVDIRCGDLFSLDIRDAAIIFVFLLPKCYDRLMAKFAAELPDSATVVVEAWPLPVPPTRKIKEEGCMSLHFYEAAAIKRHLGSIDKSAK